MKASLGEATAYASNPSSYFFRGHSARNVPTEKKGCHSSRRSPRIPRAPNRSLKQTQPSHPMPNYTDGFVVPVPKKKVKEYITIAKKAAKIWKEYGALDYK